MDHDQRFKILLEEFFPELFELFWPEWLTIFDFDSRTWLKEELFPDPPKGERLRIDLVARLKLQEPVTEHQKSLTEWLALVHVEVEARESAEQMRFRMYEYYRELRRKHGLPVLPIAIFLNVGLQGLGIDHYEEHFGQFRPLHFQYLYVGLPALDGEKYLTGNNWLGVALSAQMKLPADQRAELTAKALDRLVNSPENTWRKFLLCDCVEAYSPLSAKEKNTLNSLLVTPHYSGIQAMNKTSYDHGLESGMMKGQLAVIQDQLVIRFGPLSFQVMEKLQDLPLEKLRDIGKALLTAKSLQELGLEE